MKLSKILDLAWRSALDEWAKEAKYLEIAEKERPTSENKLAKYRTHRAWDRMESLQMAATKAENIENAFKENKVTQEEYSRAISKIVDNTEWRD